MISILSLDVSASRTGWCFTKDYINFETGVIITTAKDVRSKRLCIFFEELLIILKKYNPEYVIIEDTFSGKNIKTLKILSEFAGVAKFACYYSLKLEPFMIANTKVKSYFKTRTKKALFKFACELFEEKDLTFGDDNDIIDAKAQIIYYIDTVLGAKQYRLEKEFGYIYNI